MASSADSWMREFNEASKLADEVGSMISAKSSLLSSGPETQRHLSAARRKITILKTRLDTLQSLLPTLPSKQPLTKKEMKRRHDMLDNLVTKANQMATTLNMNHLANRDSLLGPETKRPDVISRATGLDNQGLVGFQRQVMKGISSYTRNQRALFLFLLKNLLTWLSFHLYVKQSRTRILINWRRQ